MADGFLRFNYERPPIVKSTVQVRLSWSQADMLATVDGLTEQAKDEFAFTERLTRNELFIQAQSTGTPSQQVKSVPWGLRCVDSLGVQTQIDPLGITSTHDGAYLGRAPLTKSILWWCFNIATRRPEYEAVSVSCLIENRIVPSEVRYRIEEYLAPTFEFQDKKLDSFMSFEHRIEADLRELAKAQVRGIVVIGNGSETPGFVVNVDILDERKSSLDQIESRVSFVKDIETHVFENCVTDKTRRLYGARIEQFTWAEWDCAS